VAACESLASFSSFVGVAVAEAEASASPGGGCFSVISTSGCSVVCRVRGAVSGGLDCDRRSCRWSASALDPRGMVRLEPEEGRDCELSRSSFQTPWSADGSAPMACGKLGGSRRLRPSGASGSYVLRPSRVKADLSVGVLLRRRVPGPPSFQAGSES